MNSRPLLILDLDETLISAAESESIAGDFIVFGYSVIRRPFVSEFLCDAGKHFDIAIWSSGTTDYVQAILGKILPVGIIPVFVWCRDRCTARKNFETDEIVYLKDLKKVEKRGYSLSKVLIVEDNRANVQRYYGNAIYVAPFHGDHSDIELQKLLPFLIDISQAKDFRSLEKRNWRAHIEKNSAHS